MDTGADEPAGLSTTGGATTAGLGGTVCVMGGVVDGRTILGGVGGASGGAGAATGGADEAACCTGGATGRCAGTGEDGAGLPMVEVGGAGRAVGGATASFCCVIAFSTSPGREMCERSILVLISSSPRNWRAADFGPAACASEEPRRWMRTFSASCSSRELECVFFSVTPTVCRTSRMALLLTSSSLARSLIRTLLIRPF